MKKYRIITLSIVFIISTLVIIPNINRIKQYIKRTEIFNKTNNRNLNVPANEAEKQKWVFKSYNKSVFGVDFSHYQGIINWKKVKLFNNKIPIKFVVVRATMGSNKKDIYFKHNWKKSKQKKIIRGAYHYYRPNENSIKQADNYIKRVKLEKGDLPPILDIEKVSTTQSIKSLRVGLKKWLDKIEKHYEVKPIIYTGDKFYKTYLSNGEFDDYILWIANYNSIEQPNTKEWEIWQFSDKGKINGVNEFVDLNVFNGDIKKLNKILIN